MQFIKNNKETIDNINNHKLSLYIYRVSQKNGNRTLERYGTFFI